LVKSPESDNILNINTDNITLTGATDYITGNSITTGLLVFKHTDDGTGTVTVKTVGTFPIDASNIFVKDQTNSTDALQYIPTHTSIAGVLSVLPQNGTTTEPQINGSRRRNRRTRRIRRSQHEQQRFSGRSGIL
jgi:hypothetical protein